MTSKKKKILKFSACFFVLLLFCTVLAQTIQNALLPEVETVAPLYATIKNSISVSGAIEQGNAASRQAAGSQRWSIKQIYAEKGDRVNAGDTLFRIDLAALESQRVALWADIQEQKNYINAYDWTGGDRLVLNAKLQSAESNYRAFLSAYPGNGVVTAESSGRIEWIITDEANQVQPYETYVEILDENSQQSKITWALSLLAGQKYQNVHAAAVKLAFANGETASFECSFQADRNGNDWKFEADLPPEFDPEQIVDVNIEMVLSNHSYDAVIPKECLQTDLTGGNYIYTVGREAGVFGDRIVVARQAVRVLDENDLYAAIALPGGDPPAQMKIVKNTSKPIAEGDSVCLKEKA